MSIENKSFVLCLPGNNYSGQFLVGLMSLAMYIQERGGRFGISQNYSSMVNFARCKVAGADVTQGKNQKPFGGRDYDYMLWIDSDILFRNEDFQALVDMNVDVASGWYNQPGDTTPVVESMDDDYFRVNGSYQFIKTDEMSKRQDVFKADYIGFGWVLIKQGVFEKMTYPWFAPKLRDLGDGIQDMCSEDVAWCMDAKATGTEIHVNPKVRVGHEKLLPI